MNDIIARVRADIYGVKFNVTPDCVSDQPIRTLVDSLWENPDIMPGIAPSGGEFGPRLIRRWLDTH